LSLPNPFKPGLPADPEFFGGRDSHLKAFSEYLSYAVSGNPSHMAVMGEAGIGKSSLLRKYDEIARGKECISVRRDIDATVNSIPTLIVFLLEALQTDGASNLPKSFRAKAKVKGFFTSYKVGLDAFGFGGTLERQQTSQIGLQDAFYKELIHIWKSIKENVPAVVFLLDEAERIGSIEGGWSFLRSVFTRTAEQGGQYMLVISGKLGLVAGIRETFSSIERFMTPVDLKRMVLDEVREVLEKPLSTYKRQITPEAVQQVFNMSDGHPYVVQVFGFYLFDNGSTKIDDTTIQKVLPRVITRLSGQLFKDRYEKASEAERRVLIRIAEIGKPVSPKDVPENDAAQSLKRLVEKDCLRKIKRGKYVMFNPLFAEYVKARMSK
jgi:hypothetical protein